MSKAPTQSHRVARSGRLSAREPWALSGAALWALLGAALWVWATGGAGSVGGASSLERGPTRADLARGAVSQQPSERGQRGRWSTSGSQQLTGREREAEPEGGAGAAPGFTCARGSARALSSSAHALAADPASRGALQDAAQLPRPPPASP